MQSEAFTHLHAIGTDDLKGSDHARDKLDHLVEALVTDTPGTVDEEDQVGLGTFAHCGEDTEMFIPRTVQDPRHGPSGFGL